MFLSFLYLFFSFRFSICSSPEDPSAWPSPFLSQFFIFPIFLLLSCISILHNIFPFCFCVAKKIKLIKNWILPFAPSSSSSERRAATFPFFSIAFRKFFYLSFRRRRRRACKVPHRHHLRLPV